MRTVWIAAPLALCIAVLDVGCTNSLERQNLDHKQLIAAQKHFDEQSLATRASLAKQLIQRMRHDYDDVASGRVPGPPVLDLLSISGGGDWGAFGAALMRSWADVPAGDPMARPVFDAVSGVSTGALMSPFVFVGTAKCCEVAVSTYTDARPDWVRFRGLLGFLPYNASLFDTSRLDEEVRRRLDLAMITQVAEEANKDRMLVAGATDLDLARQKVWDLGTEAKRAVATGDVKRFQDHVVVGIDSTCVSALHDRRQRVRRRRDSQQHPDRQGPTLDRRSGARVAGGESGPSLPEDSDVGLGEQQDSTRSPIHPIDLDSRRRSRRRIVDALLNGGRDSASVAALKYAALAEGIDAEVYWTAIPEEFDVPETSDMFDPAVTSALAKLGDEMGRNPKTTWHTDPPLGD